MKYWWLIQCTLLVTALEAGGFCGDEEYEEAIAIVPIALVTRLEQLREGLEFGAVGQFGQFSEQIIQRAPEIYFCRRLQRQVDAMKPAPPSIGFISIDGIKGRNLPVTIAEDTIEKIYDEFLSSEHNFQAILEHAKHVTQYADELVLQMRNLSHVLQHRNPAKSLKKDAPAYLCDSDGEKEEHEDLEKSFIDTVRDWLRKFIDINEPLVAYACSIIFPYWCQSMHNLSGEIVIASMVIGGSAIYALREKLLTQKMHRITTTALITTGMIAYALYCNNEALVHNALTHLG